jgi:hypothetical protein
MARTKSKKNNKNTPILENLMQEVKANTGIAETLINPEGEISISDAISNIIAPYREDAPKFQAFHKLVMMACAAWNASILPASERENMLADMRKLLPDQQSREDFTVVVKDLMKRKNKLYPKVNRLIIKFKVTDLGNDFHIAIASTMKKDEKAR